MSRESLRPRPRNNSLSYLERMKLALVQFRSTTGNLADNSARHQQWIRRAKAAGAKLVVFPELSLTAYEPELADKLAVAPDDQMWENWQEFCQNEQVSFALGMPIRQPKGIEIGLVLFQPDQKHQIYSKQYLHADEEPYFASGKGWDGCWQEVGVAFAICYELSVPAHAERAHQCEASIYLASVAKFENGITPTHQRLAAIAKQYQMTTLMVNAIGEADGGLCVGQSAVWDKSGRCINCTDDQQESLLLFDTATGHSEIVLV